MSLNYFMGVVVPSSILLPLAAAVYNFKYWTKQSTVIVIYLALSGTFNIISRLTIGSNNMPFLHLYTILEFLILMCFFLTLEANKKLRISYKVLMGLFPIFAVSYIYYNDAIYLFNEIPRFSSSVCVTLLLIYYLVKDLGSTESNFSMFLFTISTGLLLYYSTCSTLFGMSSTLLHTPKHIATLIWTTHASLNLLMYILFFVGFLKLRKA